MSKKNDYRYASNRHTGIFIDIMNPEVNDAF